MTKIITLEERIDREVDAIKCQCGGYAEAVECSDEEIESSLNCGKCYACCCRAFVCAVCKSRIRAKAHAKAHAPEMEY